MAAPASASTTSLVPSFYPSLAASSAEIKNLLSITSQDLNKKGFDAKIWSNYFVHTFRPQYLESIQAGLQQEKSLEKRDQLKMLERNFEPVFEKSIRQLPLLPCNGKAWKNYPREIEKAVYLIYGLKLSIGSAVFASQSTGLTYSEIELEQAAVCRHLIHLLLERLSQCHNPNNENYFILDGNGTTKTDPQLALKENGIWKLKSLNIAGDTSLTCKTWKAASGPYPNHSLLIKGNEIVYGTPFIAISFMPDFSSTDVINARKTHSPLHITDQESRIVVEAVYCIGAPKSKELGNAISFSAVSNFTSHAPIVLPNGENEGHPLWGYTEIAIRAMQKVWLEEIQKTPLEKFDFEYLYLPPTTKEEVDEKMIGVLELALELPQENAFLIEWIADQYDFDYSKEELDFAEQLAGAPLVLLEEEQKEDAEILVAPTVMAHAVIQKLKKIKPADLRPAAQRPKERSIKAATPAASSSSKRHPLSKEELSEQLSASSMPPKLKEQAVGILSGKKLVNKREADKFFLEIVRYQALASGSHVRKGNKGGSHRSIKLVKQTDEAGKSTYSAATLVDQHGRDRNRAPNLSVQQNNILSLFTPLG